MATVELLLDRELDDGRLAASNTTSQDVPVGTAFNFLLVRMADDRDVKHSIALMLVGAEFFQRPVEAVPWGHNAALQLVGEGLQFVKERLRARKLGEQIYVAAIRGST